MHPMTSALRASRWPLRKLEGAGPLSSPEVAVVRRSRAGLSLLFNVIYTCWTTHYMDIMSGMDISCEIIPGVLINRTLNMMWWVMNYDDVPEPYDDVSEPLEQGSACRIPKKNPTLQFKVGGVSQHILILIDANSQYLLSIHWPYLYPILWFRISPLINPITWKFNMSMIQNMSLIFKQIGRMGTITVVSVVFQMIFPIVNGSYPIDKLTSHYWRSITIPINITDGFHIPSFMLHYSSYSLRIS